MAKHLIFDPDECDVLGDDWASMVGECWLKMQKRNPELCRVGGAYCLWQWSQCKMAGWEGRAVASPTAMAICNKLVPFDKLEDLLNLSDEIIKEMTDPPIGGVPFYEVKVSKSILEQWALDHIKLHAKVSMYMPYGQALSSKFKKCKKELDRTRREVEKKFKKYCVKGE